MIAGQAWHAARDRSIAPPVPAAQRSLSVNPGGDLSQLQRAHVGVEVAHVEAPQDGPLDLGPALPAHLVEVGVVPDVLHGPREAPVTAEQATGAWVIGPQR